jgi:hypothetical protein
MRAVPMRPPVTQRTHVYNVVYHVVKSWKCTMLGRAPKRGGGPWAPA